MNKVVSVSAVVALAAIGTIMSFDSTEVFNQENLVASVTDPIQEIIEEKKPELDKEEYDKKYLHIANNPEPKYIEVSTTTEVQVGTTTITKVSTSTVKVEEEYLYPVEGVVYPNYGALLPFNRIIAYYGNFYSERMGVLGEYAEEEVLRRLQEEVDRWNEADPEIPALPAIHYIASTAQASPGDNGYYSLRMPDDQIEKAISMAEKIDGIVFLDLQIGLSDIRKEITYIEEFLKMPKVHLGIDPEFSMKTGDRPGTVIGHYTDDDINFVIDYLSKIVRENDLPPKVLVIHRFTQNMVQNYQNIKPTPEVQIVIHMDGWGSPERKFNTYNYVVAPEPIQFTGFKIFYGNDLKEEPHRLVTPEELLELRPNPIYIQYQ